MAQEKESGEKNPKTSKKEYIVHSLPQSRGKSEKELHMVSFNVGVGLDFLPAVSFTCNTSANVHICQPEFKR